MEVSPKQPPEGDEASIEEVPVGSQQTTIKRKRKEESQEQEKSSEARKANRNLDTIQPNRVKHSAPKNEMVKNKDKSHISRQVAKNTKI